MDGLSCREVHRIDGAVAEFGHEQAPAPEVHRHVVIPAGDARQQDGPLQHNG